MDKLIVTLSGLAGVIFTHWFFFGKKELAVEAKDTIDIIVDGGYNPSEIVLKQNQTTTLNFIRKDANPCLEEIVLSELKIKNYLPLNEKVSVVITPKSTGTFPFSCGMNMFHGKIIVK